MRKDRQKEIMAQLEAEKRASRKVKGIAFSGRLRLSTQYWHVHLSHCFVGSMYCPQSICTAESGCLRLRVFLLYR